MPKDSKKSKKPTESETLRDVADSFMNTTTMELAANLSKLESVMCDMQMELRQLKEQVGMNNTSPPKITKAKNKLIANTENLAEWMVMLFNDNLMNNEIQNLIESGLEQSIDSFKKKNNKYIKSKVSKTGKNKEINVLVSLICDALNGTDEMTQLIELYNNHTPEVKKDTKKDDSSDSDSDSSSSEDEKPAKKSPAAKKAPAKKSPAKKKADESSSDSDSDSSSSEDEKPAAKKAPAKKSPSKKSPAKKKAAESYSDSDSDSSSSEDKKPAAKKSSAKKPAAKKSPTKKKVAESSSDSDSDSDSSSDDGIPTKPISKKKPSKK